MIIYKDILTGSEIMSDGYTLEESKNGAVYEVDCAWETTKDGEIDIGANPSAEEAEESLASGATRQINAVKTFQLRYLGDEETRARAFSQKQYFSLLKAYLKDVELKLRESGAGDKEIVEFQARVQNHYVNHIKGKFKDFEFYTGSSERADGMIILLNYREDDTPYLTIWKDGLVGQKV